MDLSGVSNWIAGVLRDSGQTLVGLGGPLVAGLTVWLGHRERTKELRQRLFDARVEASLAIAVAAWKLFDAAMDDAETVEYGGARSQAWGGDWAHSFREALAFREQVKRFPVLLDAPTTEALSKFETAAARVSGYPYPWGHDPDTSSESIEAMRLTYEALIEALREMLGVDLLGQKTLRMLGKPRPGKRPVAKSTDVDRAALEEAVHEGDWPN